MRAALLPGLETRRRRFGPEAGEGRGLAFHTHLPLPSRPSLTYLQLQDQRCCLEVCPQRHPLCDLIQLDAHSHRPSLSSWSSARHCGEAPGWEGEQLVGGCKPLLGRSRRCMAGGPKQAGSGWPGRWASPWSVLGQAGCNPPPHLKVEALQPRPWGFGGSFRVDFILYPALQCDFGSWVYSLQDVCKFESIPPTPTPTAQVYPF